MNRKNWFWPRMYIKYKNREQWSEISWSLGKLKFDKMWISTEEHNCRNRKIMILHCSIYFCKISNAQNELQSKLAQSTKDKTNPKAWLKKKLKKNIFVLYFFVLFFRVVFFVLYYLRCIFLCRIFSCCIFPVLLFVLYIFVLY